MRKDRIEERIAGMERDIKELRSELKQELRSMVSELKEFQELIIEDRLGEIQDGLSREYRQIAYDGKIAEADRIFRERMTHDCPPDEDRDACITYLVDKRLRAEVTQLEEAPPGKALETLQTINEENRAYCQRQKGTACEGCYVIYTAERDKLMQLGEKFATYRKGLATRHNLLYFSQLPDDLAVSEIVDPLSHRARFAMLKTMTSGGRTYKELGNATGFSGGHLLYHLNKLTAAGLAQKDEASGLYQITDKGIGVMEIVKRMYAR